MSDEYAQCGDLQIHYSWDGPEFYLGDVYDYYGRITRQEIAKRFYIDLSDVDVVMRCMVMAIEAGERAR